MVKPPFFSLSSQHAARLETNGGENKSKLNKRVVVSVGYDFLWKQIYCVGLDTWWCSG